MCLRRKPFVALGLVRRCDESYAGEWDEMGGDHVGGGEREEEGASARRTDVGGGSKCEEEETKWEGDGGGRWEGRMEKDRCSCSRF